MYAIAIFWADWLGRVLGWGVVRKYDHQEILFYLNTMYAIAIFWAGWLGRVLGWGVVRKYDHQEILFYLNTHVCYSYILGRQAGWFGKVLGQGVVMKSLRQRVSAGGPGVQLKQCQPLSITGLSWAPTVISSKGLWQPFDVILILASLNSAYWDCPPPSPPYSPVLYVGAGLGCVMQYASS